MPTPAERSALLFVAAVAALGVGVRGCQTLRPAPVPSADREALAAQLAAVDSALTTGGATRARRPMSRSPEAHPNRSGPRDRGVLSSGGVSVASAAADPVDADRATAAELDVLPGIGPALAARIVADRDSLGPFGSVEGLQRVRGIGPALAAKLAPRLRFTGRPRQAVHP